MTASRLRSAAGGGLIERRSFLAAGLSFLAASAAPASEPAAAASPGGERLADRVPDWMKTLGGPDLPYGLPAESESGVLRKVTAQAPEMASFVAWHTPIEKLNGIITPNGLHFGVHHNGIPDIVPSDHRFMIHGLVERPIQFTVEQLLRYPMVSHIRFLECAGNTAHNAVAPGAIDTTAQELFGQISGAEWTGVPLSLLLREAGVKDNASWVIAESADSGSHARSIPLTKLMDDAIIALFQNGERLRPSQGYPMRLFLPGWEGNTNVKWLHRLELTDTAAYTKDESGLYTEILKDGRIARFSFHMDVKSVITHPSGMQTLPEKGFYEISGLAWSGYGRIVRVEVSADEGKSWTEATLHGPALDKALTRFSIPWFWDGAPTTLLSRATDEHGRVQPARARWKERYAVHSFNHYNAIQAWHVTGKGRLENVYL